MYIIILWVIGVRILWKLKPKMIGLGLSYDMRVIRSVNRLHVDNLWPSGIEGDSFKISVDFNMKTMNIYKERKKNLLCFRLTWECYFYPGMGDVTVGIRAQVAIPGIGMIIWFWNVFQDGENKARSQDWSIPSSGKWLEFSKWKWSRLGSLGRHLLSYTCNISVLWSWWVNETLRWLVVPSGRCVHARGIKQTGGR